MDNEKYLGRLEKFQDQSWESLRHHKDQTTKLTYWVATFLIGFYTFIQKNDLDIFDDQVFVVIFYLSTLGIFLFFLHHHLAVRFYSQVLKNTTKLIKDEYKGELILSKSVSPFILYKQIFCHKKNILCAPFVKNEPTSNNGLFVGYASELLMFMLILIMFYVVKSAFNKPIAFIFTIIVPIIILMIYERLRLEYATQVKQKFKEFKK